LKSRWSPDLFLRDLVGGMVGIFPRNNLPAAAAAPRIIR
jgi:hypothetical protein